MTTIKSIYLIPGSTTNFLRIQSRYYALHKVTPASLKRLRYVLTKQYTTRVSFDSYMMTPTIYFDKRPDVEKPNWPINERGEVVLPLGI